MNTKQPAAMLNRSPESMTNVSPFAPYAELFDAVGVVPEEENRFVALRAAIKAWVEDEGCYRVAVGQGTVSHPRVFTATMRSRDGAVRITRLFPPEDQYERQLGVGAPIVFVVATGRKRRGEHTRYVKKAHLFRAPEGNRPES